MTGVEANPKSKRSLNPEGNTRAEFLGAILPGIVRSLRAVPHKFRRLIKDVVDTRNDRDASRELIGEAQVHFGYRIEVLEGVGSKSGLGTSLVQPAVIPHCDDRDPLAVERQPPIPALGNETGKLRLLISFQLQIRAVGEN